MTGPVHARALPERGRAGLIPDAPSRERLNAAILDELCQGVFDGRGPALFVRAIDDLKARSAECVVLGCTEIPLVVTPANASLPVLDSTRLLARYAVRKALS